MASIKDNTVVAIDEINPMGTDGFEFVEYAAPDPAALGALFESMGFVKVAKHRSKETGVWGGGSAGPGGGGKRVGECRSDCPRLCPLSEGMLGSLLTHLCNAAAAARRLPLTPPPSTPPPLPQASG